MKILMLSPAHGHNIKPFLDYFNRHREHSLTLLYAGANIFKDDQYKNIRFIQIKKGSFLYLLKVAFLARQGFDLIWIQGPIFCKFVLNMLLVKRRKTKININIWSESFLDRLIQNNAVSMCFRYILSKSDFVQCNWHNTAEKAKGLIPNANVVVLLWGLPEEYFTNSEKHEVTEETRDFLHSLRTDRYKFFFSKSFLPSNMHTTLLDAAKILVEEGVHNFQIILRGGNALNPQVLKELKKRVTDYGMEDIIIFMELPFLPFEDIKHIWKHMDCGLAIAEKDQLSTTFIEPMFFGKEIIASDIPSYRIFNDKYRANLDLVQNSAMEIADKLKHLIQGNKTPEEYIKKRQTILKDYRFEKNMEIMLKYFRENS